LPVLAKGVLAGKRNNSAALQPFQPLLVKIAGRGEVRVLALGEANGAAFALQGRGLFCGFYLNELLMRLLGRDDPHPQLYHRYTQALEALRYNNDIEPVLRRFEIALLGELGYQPEFDRLADGSRPESDGCYAYRIEEGLEHAQLHDPGAVTGRTLQALCGEAAFGDQERRQARLLMRRILSHYLGGRPLKSRELFQTQTGMSNR
jgi:DNA repair protein RecO (recombination protein O)